MRKGKRQQVKPFSYGEALEALIVNHEWRNEAIVRLAERFRKRAATMIIIDRLEHGELLGYALDAPFMQGKLKGISRQKSWSALREGELDCAVVTKIADEGLNIPNLGFIILGGGGKARHKLVQRLGRGRRAFGDKERLVAVDFKDKGMNLGPHTTQRFKAYEEDPSVTVHHVTLAELLEEFP